MSFSLFWISFLSLSLMSISEKLTIFPLENAITAGNLINRGTYLANESNFNVTIIAYQNLYLHLLLKMKKPSDPIYSLAVIPQIKGKGNRVVPDSKGPTWRRDENSEFVIIDGKFDLLQLKEFNCDNSEGSINCDYSFNFITPDMGGATNLLLNGKFKVNLLAEGKVTVSIKQ